MIVGSAADSPAMTRAAVTAAPVAGLVLALGIVFGWRQGALLVVGLGLGHALYHAAFGFTGAFRVMLADRRTAGLRAQMVMLGLGCVLFFPALAHGSLFGMPVTRLSAGLGPMLVVGAFLFGVGMQMGGGCASGTLFAVGGGNARMVVTLAAFIAGSLIGTAHLPWWQQLPVTDPIVVATPDGWRRALLLHIALFLVIVAVARAVERRRHGDLGSITTAAGDRTVAQRLLRGPWPLVWGAAALAVLNFLTLALAGRPWGITSALALWGAKLVTAVGVDVASWPYWRQPAQAMALQRPLLADITTVMNLGIVLGAFGAAALAGRFRPRLDIPWRSLLAAIVGGLMLGYGARLASGCNIGVYFSGVLSGSMHGWLWLLAALGGNAVGVRLRPWFGLVVEGAQPDAEPRRAADIRA